MGDVLSVSVEDRVSSHQRSVKYQLNHAIKVRMWDVRNNFLAPN